MFRLQVSPSVRLEAGPRTAEAIENIAKVINSWSRQFDWDPAGPNTPPNPPAALNVTAANGMANLQIVDSFPTSTSTAASITGSPGGPTHMRTITYTVEAATDANFVNIVHTEYLGHARNKNVFLGSQTLFFRVFSQTFGSQPSKPTYFGGATPSSIAVGGVAAPTQQSYQGSGTSTVGGQGFGRAVGTRVSVRQQ